MEKLLERLDKDEALYGKMYSNIMDAIHDTSEFEVEGVRKYTIHHDAISGYLDLIKTIKNKINKMGFFSKFMYKPERDLSLLDNYKKEYHKAFTQISNCHKCKCLNCIKSCEFSTCLGCAVGSKIVHCDHDDINVTVHSLYTLSLNNNDTNEDKEYNVVATIQSLKRNQRYIVIHGITDPEEKFILYHTPGIKDDKYDEIEDAEEFDMLVELLNKCGIN